MITFVAADGTEHRFAVQTSLTPQARSEERTLQLLEALNAVMERHPQSRRRNLRFYAPTVIPAWPQVRLVEDDKNQGTYGEVYEANCARYGRDPDIPMELFKAALNPAVLGQVSGPEAVLELRLKAFMDIASQHVTENIFSQYMYKTLPNGAHLWTFKRQLCQQLALSSFVSALLRIGGRTPRKISFAKNTGKVFMLDFYPNFDSNGLVEYAEPVPFRLTRNLHAFFTPFGVKGDFVATMAAAAQACATLVETCACTWTCTSRLVDHLAAGDSSSKRNNKTSTQTTPPRKRVPLLPRSSPNLTPLPSTKWPKRTSKKP